MGAPQNKFASDEMPLKYPRYREHYSMDDADQIIHSPNFTGDPNTYFLDKRSCNLNIIKTQNITMIVNNKILSVYNRTEKAKSILSTKPYNAIPYSFVSFDIIHISEIILNIQHIIDRLICLNILLTPSSYKNGEEIDDIGSLLRAYITKDNKIKKDINDKAFKKFRVLSVVNELQRINMLGNSIKHDFTFNDNLLTIEPCYYSADSKLLKKSLFRDYIIDGRYIEIPLEFIIEQHNIAAKMLYDELCEKALILRKEAESKP